VSTKKEEAYLGTGRRKTSVARVRITNGDGKIVVNNRDFEKFFRRLEDKIVARAPLDAVGCQKKVNVKVRVVGGGNTGQAGAFQLGVARALVKMNAEYEQILRDRRYLTRDAREVERKKAGRAGARRSFQFSKR
jgi:small subunit ribosomal protein S9